MHGLTISQNKTPVKLVLQKKWDSEFKPFWHPKPAFSLAVSIRLRITPEPLHFTAISVSAVQSIFKYHQTVILSLSYDYFLSRMSPSETMSSLLIYYSQCCHSGGQMCCIWSSPYGFLFSYSVFSKFFPFSLLTELSSLAYTVH